MHPADQQTLDWFARTRDKTTVLSERIPADLFNRAIEGEIGDAEAVLFHIARAADWWMGKTILDGKSANIDYETGRDGVLDALVRSKHRLLSFFTPDEHGSARMDALHEMADGVTRRAEIEEGGTPDWVGREWVHYITSHEVHHRGRIVLAMRVWGCGEFPFLP